MPMIELVDTATPDVRPDIARISPELALVDPELARRVRHRIPRKRPGHRPPLPVLRLASASVPAEAAKEPTAR
jgi:hypothetical protein